MLLHFGVIPYIVFDGDYLPSKAKTEVERAKRREESKQRGLELYRLNKPSQAHLELQKAVDVTPEMARQFIDELKKIGVQYVVAPYEADAQMVYLEKKGIIQGILSEDSDLLVFGAKRLLTKLDQYGDCIEINRVNFTSCKVISMAGWTDAEFRRMAILSGCDYLASINRMGLKTAYRLVRKYKTVEKIIRMLQFDGQYHVPPGYLDAFYKAELTFLHQRVFCPLANDIVMMTELEQRVEAQDLSFIGEQIEQKIAIGVAIGDLDPMTKTPIRVQQSNTATPPRTMWETPCRSTMGESFLGMKENKSIETFFKSKRTPLAELDVNSFTPSPTQAQILQQNEGASWDSSPALASAPSPGRTTSAYSQSLQHAFSNRRTMTPTSSSKFGTTKKRKLMSDEEALESPHDLQGTSSKFFTGATPDTTLKAKGQTGGRRKTTDFEIWSDDSVENTMIELAGNMNASEPPSDFASGDPGKGKTLYPKSSYQDPCQKTSVKKDSGATPSSRAIVQIDKSMGTASTSPTESAQSITKAMDDSIKAELADVMRNSPQNAEEISQDFEQVEMKSQKNSISSQDTDQTARCREKSITPLQRLGFGALNRSKSYNALTCDAISQVGSFETLLRRSSERKTGTKAGSPPSMPLAYTLGPDASTAKGSEDAIIPSSEEEGGDVLSDPEERTPKPSINLGRFAFTG